MDKIYFITDLDRTIIHSKNKGFKCVEKIEDREITYMTDYSYNSFMEILKLEYFQFIPCTMRNINQTLRVNFIRQYNPRIIICTNGAQIYINGKLDAFWDKTMRNLIDAEEVKKDISYLESLNLGCLEVRNIEDFYITVKFETGDLAAKSYELIKDKFKIGIEVIKIGVKIFIINEKINKLMATDYIIGKFDMKNIITSGDSQVDREFTKRGVSILPKHSSFIHEESIITLKDGIYATDDLLDRLKIHIKLLNYKNCEKVKSIC